MKRKNLKERGITLIALVITIIVLLILAGVTLSIVLHTGIIDNSQKAVDTYQAKAEDEVKQLDDLTLKIQTQFGILDNTEGKENKTITGSEKSTYNNPIIPVGFKTSNDGASWKSSDGETVDGWNDGLVIEDKEGNQFVWVPAYVGEDINGEYTKNKVPKYEKWDGSLTSVKVSEIPNDTLPMLSEEENTSQDKIKECEEKQIGNCGGFYIGRYEAGTELLYDDRNNTETIKDVKPLSKQGQMPWNYISYYNAKERAESMYKTNEVQSVLVTGTMWDTVMKWFENNDINVQTQTTENAWGNYKDVEVTGISGYWDYSLNGKKMTNEGWKTGNKPANTAGILRTGESEFTKKKNIYDLAGNVWEWTNEMNIVRGGNCGENASDCPAMRRNGSTPSSPTYYITFRVALYIK